MEQRSVDLAGKALDQDVGTMPRQPEFVHEVLRNRSLSRLGQRLALLIVGGTTVGVGLAITLLYGAWPVLPFAGLEWLGLWWAFRWLSGHDLDYERIVIDGSELQHELRIRSRLWQRSWNRHWCTVVCSTRRSRVELRVRSHGREAVIGRMMMDEDKARLAEELRALLRVEK